MHRWLPAVLIIILLGGFRVLGSLFPTTLPNLQPLPAILLCSLVFLQGYQRWLIPLAVWVITDPLTSLAQNYPIFGWHHLSLLLGILPAIAIARTVRGNPTPFSVLSSAILCAASFYFLTNLVSFAIDPLYPKTAQGFLQAQWTGPVGFGPTWIFLRNLVAANLVFTGLFLAARQSLPAPLLQPSNPIAR